MLTKIDLAGGDWVNVGAFLGGGGCGTTEITFGGTGSISATIYLNDPDHVRALAKALNETADKAEEMEKRQGTPRLHPVYAVPTKGGR